MNLQTLISKRNRIERDMDRLEAKGLDQDNEYLELDEQLDTVIDEINRLQVIEDKMQIERAEQRRLEELKTRIESKYEMDFEEWYQRAKAMYTITDKFTVISNACNWKEEKKWKFNSKIDAIEKVEQLIDYKYYDHFMRKSKD